MRRVGSVVVILFVLASGARAQDPPQLRDVVSRGGTDILLTWNVCGPWASPDEMLRNTDLIVQAVVGHRTARLSGDGRDVETRIELVTPSVLFSAAVQSSRQPGPGLPVHLMQKGGRVVLDGFEVTVHYKDVLALKEGTEIVALLHEIDGMYWPVACDGNGLFEVRGSVVQPLGRWQGTAGELVGISPSVLVSQLTQRKAALARE